MSTLDLSLPHVPDRYSLDPSSQLVDDGTMSLIWKDAAGYFITFDRS